MTTYERIIALIKSGRTPIVKDKDGDYGACIYQKDGNVYVAGWYYNINDTYEYIDTIRTKEEIEGVNREIVRIDTPDRITYKEGDLVDLDIEALEKTDNWTIYKEYYNNGNGFIIQSINSNKIGTYCEVYTESKRNSSSIGLEYLLPHTPQDNKVTLSDEELLEELRKRNLLEELRKRNLLVNKEVVK